jgi:DNA polymerase-1
VKYLIVDGSNYLFRAYFGVPSAANYKGTQINAVYGFFAILRRMARSVNPTHIIVVFDSQTGTKSKVEKNPEYKANREFLDTGMYVQLPYIKSILDRCNIHWIEPEHEEADDVIGSLAKQFCIKNNASFISSNDYDFAQLTQRDLTLVRDVQGRAVHITPQVFVDEWGFEPQRYLDYISIKGDSSDNISGVEGIGQKIATMLIQKYDSIEDMCTHCRQLPSRIANKILAESDKIRSNRSFLRINTEINITLSDKSGIFDAHSLYTVKTNEHLANLEL